MRLFARPLVRRPTPASGAGGLRCFGVESFAAEVASWQGAYVLIGGMAATLTGLLFVAVSLNLRTIMSNARPDLRLSAIRTLNQFVLLVELSIVFQIPSQSPVTLGGAIAVLAVISLIVTVATTRDAVSSRGQAVSSSLLFGAFAVVGALMMTGNFELLYLMVSLVIGTLISAVFGAWTLMVEVGQDDTA